MTGSIDGRLVRGLAGIGTALLGAAALSLVSARWEQYGPGARLGLLLAASAVVFGATNLLRRMAPETTRALDVLVATLVPVDVAAVVIVTGGSWRAALVAAGLVGMVASETLRLREPSFVTEVGTAAGGAVFVSGLAAQYDVSGPAALALLGFATVAGVRSMGPRWFPVLWAVVAGLAPAFRVLEDAVFTGMGTMRELGLIEAADLWEIALTGVLATMTLVLLAVRRQQFWLALPATATAAATGVELWGRADPPDTVVLVAAAVALGLVELVLAVPDVRARRRVSAVVGDVSTVVSGGLTAVVGTAAWFRLSEGDGGGEHFALTATVLAVVWLIADVRRGEEAGQRRLARWLVGADWWPGLVGFVVSTTAAVYLASESPLALGVTLLGLGLLAMTTLRPGRLAIAVAGLVAAPVLTHDHRVVMAIVSTVAVGGLLVVVDLLVRSRHRQLAPSVAMAVVVPAVAGAFALDGLGATASGVYLLAVLWSAAHRLHAAVPDMGPVLRLIGLVGLGVMADDGLAVVALAAAVLAVVSEIEYQHGSDPFHRALVAITGTIAWTAAMGAADVDVVELYLLAPMWVVLAAAVWLGYGRGALPAGLAATVALTTIGRVEDGRAVHTLILGVVALVVAVVAAVRGERLLLATAGAVAVSAATYEVLARSVGVQTWGWMVVGGTAAVVAAGLLEVVTALPPSSGTASGGPRVRHSNPGAARTPRDDDLESAT